MKYCSPPTCVHWILQTSWKNDAIATPTHGKYVVPAGATTRLYHMQEPVLQLALTEHSIKALISGQVGFFRIPIFLWASSINDYTAKFPHCTSALPPSSHLASSYHTSGL